MSAELLAGVGAVAAAAAGAAFAFMFFLHVPGVSEDFHRPDLVSMSNEFVPPPPRSDRESLKSISSGNLNQTVA